MYTSVFKAQPDTMHRNSFITIRIDSLTRYGWVFNNLSLALYFPQHPKHELKNDNKNIYSCNSSSSSSNIEIVVLVI